MDLFLSGCCPCTGLLERLEEEGDDEGGWRMEEEVRLSIMTRLRRKEIKRRGERIRRVRRDSGGGEEEEEEEVVGAVEVAKEKVRWRIEDIFRDWLIITGFVLRWLSGWEVVFVIVELALFYCFDSVVECRRRLLG